MAKIGFIGLGNMGLPMAANLVRAGHDVVGFDIVHGNNATARACGITIASGPATACHRADVVITMLPSGNHMLYVYGTGILETSAPNAVFVDCSTIDVASARAAHALAAKAGRRSLDCPVSGGVAGAEAASLTLMAGGTDDAFAAAEPVLKAVSKKIVHCGAAGAGQAAKICNNLILGISMIAVAEGFVLGEKLGLSHQALFDVASTSSGQCWALTSYCPVPGPVPASPANNGFKPGFSAALMLKDIKLAAQCAKETGTSLALGAKAESLYQAFVDAGSANQDFSAIIEAIRKGPA